MQTRKHAVSRPLLLAILLIACAGLRAQQLPIKTYTTADGLPRNGINRIVRDSHGFLWFCTTEGLSRFDGYTFTNYGLEQGLPDRMVTGLIETRSGEYWIATFNGIARFNPNGGPANPAGNGSPEPKFVHYPTNWHPAAREVMAICSNWERFELSGLGIRAKSIQPRRTKFGRLAWSRRFSKGLQPGLRLCRTGVTRGGSFRASGS